MGIINTELSPSDPLDAGIASLEAIDAQFIASIEKIEGFPCGLDSVGEARAALYYSNGPTKLDPKKPGRKSRDRNNTRFRRALPPIIDEVHERLSPSHRLAPRVMACGGPAAYLLSTRPRSLAAPIQR